MWLVVAPYTHLRVPAPRCCLAADALAQHQRLPAALPLTTIPDEPAAATVRRAGVANLEGHERAVLRRGLPPAVPEELHDRVAGDEPADELRSRTRGCGHRFEFRPREVPFHHGLHPKDLAVEGEGAFEVGDLERYVGAAGEASGGEGVRVAGGASGFGHRASIPPGAPRAAVPGGLGVAVVAVPDRRGMA